MTPRLHSTALRLLAFLCLVLPPVCAQAADSRAQILARMESVMGPLPKHSRTADLKIQVTEEVDCGRYTRKLLTYESEPNSRVPAYLLIPKSSAAAKPFGVLTLHQTHAAGHKVVVGLGDSPDDEYAVELAERGFICLAPAYPHLANYAPDLASLGYRSGTMKAIWDNIRGLDLLAQYAGADPDRFAAIGHSLGGHNSLFTAAFDDRLKIVVTSCGFDSFRDYKNGDIKGWTSHRYMPKLLDFAPDCYPFDFDDVLAAIAPRSLFINAPIGDANFKWDSVDRVIARARQLRPAPWLIQVEHPAAAHSFPKKIHHRALDLIQSTLQAVPPK